MRLPPRLYWFLAGLHVFVIDAVLGHSTHRNPVSYITSIEGAEILTPSHRIHAHSSFNLIFTLHDGEQDVKFTLEPNHDILSEGAQVEYMDGNGVVTRTEPIVRSEVKVFRGDSWLRDERGWYHAGWARILVKRDGLDPLFEGAFTLHHDAHHIQLASSYMKTRHELDPRVDLTGDKPMVVFRDSDVESGMNTQGLVGRGAGVDTENDFMCPSDQLGFNTQPSNLINMMITEMPKAGSKAGSKAGWGGLGLESLFRGGMTKRQNVDGSSSFPGGSGNSAGVNLRNTIGNTDGCPTTRQVALIGVATDCTYTADFATEEDARENIINQINSASNLFERTFNITLGLSAFFFSNATCPETAPSTALWNVPCSTPNSTIEDRLNLFSEWRGTRSSDSNALWTLMTTCETGASVGLAWLGQLCEKGSTPQGSQTVSGANVIARTSTEWKVIAHEIGHTMGAVHDCTSQTCAASSTMAAASMCCPLSASTCDAGGRYLMNPSTSDQIEAFSPCSVGNICSAFKRRSVNTSCLTSNKDVSIITKNECGNGIVETGEDCDCGGTEGCGTNKCCNPTTCKFVDNAVCDDANEDCCRECQFAAASVICRPGNGPCDPQEKCPGNGSTCPTDIIAKNGISCGGGLQCASGQCTSRDQQCQTVMGRYSPVNDTRSCGNTDCQLTCASPEFGQDVCFRMQQNFLDGTPCLGDGACKNGICAGSSPLGEIKSWIDKNRNIVIGVGAALGALFLFSIFSCCVSRCRRRRHVPVKNSPPPPNFAQSAYDPRWQNYNNGYRRSPNAPPVYPTASPPDYDGRSGAQRSGPNRQGSGSYPGQAQNPYQQPQSVRYA